MRSVYTICKDTGATVFDTLIDAEVFYLSSDPRLLKKHLQEGEHVREVSPSILKRAWVLRNGKKPIRICRGIVLATPTKTFAKQIIEAYKLKAVPSLFG